MKTIKEKIIFASDIDAETIREAMSEIELNFPNDVRTLMQTKKISSTEALEVIATHIIMTDTDFIVQ